MAAVSPKERAVVATQSGLLIFLYIFLYFPIFFIIYVSFVDNTVWPFPPEFTWEWYQRLWIMSDFHLGLQANTLTKRLGCTIITSDIMILTLEDI